MQEIDVIEMSRAFKSERVIEDIAFISRFHRVQGSVELVKAAEFVYNSLKDENIQASMYIEHYNGEDEFANMSVPIGWEPVYGEVHIDEKMLNSEMSKLVIVTHSPPGECESEIIVVERDEDWKYAMGKIVLVRENWRENYRKAVNHGAVGYIIYRKGLGNGIPYVGLFLRKEDLYWANIPAVAIDENLAKEIIKKRKNGESVIGKILVRSKIKEEKLPIVYATVGKPPYILFTAHICHPKPGANDNASGSAMLLEIARILRKSYNEKFRFGYAFLWIPEHIGSSAFAVKYANLKDYYGVINLDMVGGKSLLVINPPLSRFTLISGVVEHFLKIFNAHSSDFGALPKILISYHPYRMGSDHDIFNIFGVPALALITWPDPNYHSSKDSVDKIERDTVEIIGRAMIASALYLSTNSMREFAHAYSMKYLGEMRMKNKIRIAKSLVDHGLWRDGRYLKMKIGREMKENGFLIWLRRGAIFPDSVKGNRGKEYRKFSQNRENLAILHELLMLGELLPLNKALTALEEEYGKIKREELVKILKLLKEERFIDMR